MCCVEKQDRGCLLAPTPSRTNVDVLVLVLTVVDDSVLTVDDLEVVVDDSKLEVDDRTSVSVSLPAREISWSA